MARLTIDRYYFPPTVTSVLNITEASRTSTTTQFNLNFVTNLGSSTSYIGNGVTLDATIEISANGMATQSRHVQLKSSAEYWSGTGTHTTNTTLALSIPSSVNSINVKYTLTMSDETDTPNVTTTMSLTKLVSQLQNISTFSFTDENDNPTEIPLGITKYDSNYSQTLKVYDMLDAQNPILITTRENVENGYLFAFTEEELNGIYERNTNNKFVTLRFVLETYNGNTFLGDMYVPSVGMISSATSSPIYNDFTYKDVNSTTTRLTGNDQNIVLGYSTLQVNTGVATPQKSARLVSWVIDREYPYEDNKIVEIPNYNATNIQVSVVDSRTNSTPILKELNTISYSALVKGNQSIGRVNNVTDQAEISFDGSYWNKSFGAITNDLSVSYKFKTTDSDEWIDGTGQFVLTKNEDKFSFNGLLKGNNENNGFDVSKSFNIELIVSDELSSITYIYTLIAGVPALKVKGNKVIELNNNEPISGEIDDDNNVQLKDKDGNDLSIKGNQIYSTEEMKIGTWLDGKPVYRKCIEIGSMPNNTSRNVPHNITNISTIVDYSMSWYDSEDARWYCGSNVARMDNNNVFIKATVNRDYFIVTSGGTDWSVRTRDAIAIIEYTKTTD